MRNKGFKPSNKYRRTIGSGRVSSGGGSKRPLIIGISIGVAVLLIAAIVLTVVLLNKNDNTQNPNNGVTNQGSVNVPSVPNVEQEANLVNIQITHLPNKTTYYCGELFDMTGLSVYYLMSDNSFLKLDLSACEITGFDSSVAAEKQEITVSYKEFTDTFTITVKELEKVDPELVSISFETMPKTEYKVGDPLRSKDGVLLCTYSDGTTKTVQMSNKYVYGFDNAMSQGVGEYDITVKYSENGVQVSTTYKITITE